MFLVGLSVSIFASVLINSESPRGDNAVESDVFGAESGGFSAETTVTLALFVQ